jgi:hypothetical protein
MSCLRNNMHFARGQWGETVGLTGQSVLKAPYQIAPDLLVSDRVLDRDLSSPYADTPTRRHAGPFPLS